MASSKKRTGSSGKTIPRFMALILLFFIYVILWITCSSFFYSARDGGILITSRTQSIPCDRTWRKNECRVADFETRGILKKINPLKWKGDRISTTWELNSRKQKRNEIAHSKESTKCENLQHEKMENKTKRPPSNISDAPN